MSRWRLALLVWVALSARAQPAAPAVIPAHEDLDYDIEWRLIPAGTAKLTWAAMSGGAMSVANSTGELRLHLESAGLVSRLFRVSDDYTAALGAELLRAEFVSIRP